MLSYITRLLTVNPIDVLLVCYWILATLTCLYSMLCYELSSPRRKHLKRFCSFLETSLPLKSGQASLMELMFFNSIKRSTSARKSQISAMLWTSFPKKKPSAVAPVFNEPFSILAFLFPLAVAVIVGVGAVQVHVGNGSGSAVWAAPELLARRGVCFWAEECFEVCRDLFDVADDLAGALSDPKVLESSAKLAIVIHKYFYAIARLLLGYGYAIAMYC